MERRRKALGLRKFSISNDEEKPTTSRPIPTSKNTSTAIVKNEPEGKYFILFIHTNCCCELFVLLRKIKTEPKLLSIDFCHILKACIETTVVTAIACRLGRFLCLKSN